MGSPIVANHITKLICLTFRFGVLGFGTESMQSAIP